ncbi:hypothetical protein [Hyalangium versicolor]|uniref:hypothetical protein n=1 Tax=Hyalangium versicolor TaxID=2861190 RepID=UPI001CC9FFD1|nr:hypothetical protein [Hyalangium versicolor]
MSTPLPPMLSLELRRDAERLFETTMWCLGRDVNHPEGNLLLRRGLTRERPPEGQRGSSVYSASFSGGGGVELWAFGVLCHDGGEATFIRREGFTPLLVDVSRVAWPVFEAEALGGAQPPSTDGQQRRCRAAVVTLAEWLARYEEWVVKEVGLSWRRECLAQRRKAPPVAAEELAAAWWRLSSRTRLLELALNDFIAPAVGA